MRTAIRGNVAFFMLCVPNAHRTLTERSPNDDDLQPIHNRVANTLTSGAQS